MRAFAHSFLLLALSVVACKGDPIAPDPNEDVSLRVDVVECGGETCDLLEGELCCFKGTKRDGCGMSCNDGQLECDGPEDCPDEAPICCGDRDGSHCGTSCDLPVCHDHNDCKDFEHATKCFASAFVEMNYCKKP